MSFLALLPQLIYSLWILIFLGSNTLCHSEEMTYREIPTDLTRDIIQPIGMPIVTAYHALRENFFLNTKINGDNLIENIGDFFLTPSQYLFAGKNIIIYNVEEGNCEISQTHDYKKLYWIKTTASILALPISEILGSLFKWISFLYPEVRHRHEIVNKSLKSIPVNPQSDIFLLTSIAPFLIAGKKLSLNALNR